MKYIFDLNEVVSVVNSGSMYNGMEGLIRDTRNSISFK